jgi:putative ABC transport system substrate-binding protein
LVGERVRILKKVVPDLDKVSMLVNGTNPANRPQYALLRSEAATLGIQAQLLDVRTPPDIAPSIGSALAFGAKALVHANDSFINSQRAVIAKLAAQNRLPVIYVDREYVVTGGLMSLGPGHRQGDIGAAQYIDSILRGASPADLPVAVPTAFVFTVSRSALQNIGITLPKERERRTMPANNPVNADARGCRALRAFVGAHRLLGTVRALS